MSEMAMLHTIYWVIFSSKTKALCLIVMIDNSDDCDTDFEWHEKLKQLILIQC